MSDSLTTRTIGPAQQSVVWTPGLHPESEGPSLISCGARQHQVGVYISTSSLRRRGARIGRIAQDVSSAQQASTRRYLTTKGNGSRGIDIPEAIPFVRLGQTGVVDCELFILSNPAHPVMQFVTVFGDGRDANADLTVRSWRSP